MVALAAGLEPFPGYRLRRILGRGGFSEVWEAETDVQGFRALKFLSCSGGEATTRALRADQSLHLLSHPHLLRASRTWTWEGYVVVEMDAADGTLLELLQLSLDEFDEPLDPPETCRLLTQVADGLDFLNARRHRLGGRCVALQHCDVKPNNMLLFGEKTMLSDFGLAAETCSPVASHRPAGTMEYCAPEVFQGRLSDWTDQYSLAVSYCHLRGGCLPFNDTPSQFDRAYTRPEPDLSMLSEAERPVVARALDRVPQQRWPSCAEFIARLSYLSSSGREKRRELRHRVGSVTIMLSDLQGGGSPTEGWLVDRSEGGLGLRIAERLPEGAVVNVRATRAASIIPWVKVEVRHCRSQGQYWLAGCRFVGRPSGAALWYLA